MRTFSLPHVTLVTGASSGIGAATACAFANQGSLVAIHYNRGGDAAQDVAKRIHKGGAKALVFQADLSNPENCRSLVRRVLEACGRIDVLVNNAGSLVDRKMLLDITDEFWQHVIDVNLNSAFWMTQSAAKQMIDRRSGAIINVSSISARNGGGPGALAYATAKGAMTAMTKGLAKELINYGIRVNAVNPGVVLTPFHERFSSPALMKAMVSAVPQARPGKPEEVAGTIVFLASDAASYVVGESIEVNGGMLME